MAFLSKIRMLSETVSYEENSIFIVLFYCYRAKFLL